MLLNRSRTRGVAALCLALASATLATPSEAQRSSVPSEGVAARAPRHVVLDAARVVVEPGRVLEPGSIELLNGKIVAVRSAPIRSPGATIRDLGSRTVFAGFIDPAATIGVPEEMQAGGIKPLPPGQAPHQTTLDQPGARYWNRRVRPEWSVADRLDFKVEDAAKLRKLGYAAVYAIPGAGVVKGQGALLSLRDSSQDKDVTLARDVAQHFGFELAGGFSSEYPGSLMGAMALIRQSLLDARWHAQQKDLARVEANTSLDALAAAAQAQQRTMFQLNDELDVGRVSGLVREFDLDAVLIGTGHEYRVLKHAKASGTPFILPLALPEPPAVEDADIAINTSLAELQHWEQAPANAARVAAAGIAFAFTARGLADAEKNFWPSLQKAVRAGLSEDLALAALTTAPAEMLGESRRLGKIAPGQLANLVIADGDLFRREGATLYETWVEGERFEHAASAEAKAIGDWTLTWADGRGPRSLSISGEGNSLDGRSGETRFKLKLDGEQLLALPPAALFGAQTGSARVSARVRDDAMEGYRDLADGRRVRFTGKRVGSGSADSVAKEDAIEAVTPIPDFRGYPAGEYARPSLPDQPEVVLVRNATVWTNTADGVRQGVDVLVRQGRIDAVGVKLSAPADAVQIDAAGRHLTPGIIDAHSHTAIARNVNEPSHAVTTEVRVADALDPTDIDIYRQLAGGVTAANLLHGSANPMGGQNAVIKLRWGEDADGLLMSGAKPGVKFALGENVKQSGWGEAFTSRYPQTRMGVEQIMRDHFNAAREYRAARSAKDGDGVRQDLRMDALAEILAGERVIHVHSYRQDEILMFARLARDYDLSVATFQHVLEGYKVADAIAEIGAGGSTFADWWGYKMEVVDGIPHNGALMTRAGVITSFNSDSNEMARRLNMEAAKAMRHGGLDEQEALKLITLNPALQLHIADRTGAIRPGLDADFVLWSDHPLSNYARAEQTWIDGRRYFDRDEDRAMQQQLGDERERLLQLALAQRSKTLELVDSKQKGDGEDAAPDAASSKPSTVSAFDRGSLIEAAASRGLYHSGADLSSCGLHDHAH